VRMKNHLLSIRKWCALAAGLYMCATPSAFSQDLSAFHAAAHAYDAQWLAARHALDAARMLPGQARAGLLPQVSLTASRQEEKGYLFFADEPPVDKDVQGRMGTVELTQGLLRPAQWWALRQANAQEAQALAQYHASGQQMGLRVVQAYLDAWVADESVRLSKVQLTAVRAQLELAQRNFDVGATTITDVYEAQAKLDLGLAQATAAESELQNRLVDLERLTGLWPMTLHGLSEDAVLAGADVAPLDQWMVQAQQMPPEVQAAQASLAVAEAEQSRQKAGLLPTVDLTFRKSLDRRSGSVTAPTDVPYRNRTTQALLSVSWPIFEGGRSYFQIRESAYSLNRAQAELDGAQRLAESAVRQAHTGLRSGKSQIRALRSGSLSSLKALDASRVGYRIGTRINKDVLDAEAQYYGVQRDLAKAKADTVMHWARLHAAIGALTPETVERINSWLLTQGQPISMFDSPTDKQDSGSQISPPHIRQTP